MKTAESTAPRLFLRFLRATLAALALAAPSASGAEWQPRGIVPAPALTGEKALAHLKESGQYESLSGAITAAHHAVREVEDAPGEAWAQNSGHGLNARFTPEGLRLRVRTEAGDTHHTQWTLDAVGRESGDFSKMPPGTVRAKGERAEIVRPGLTEWFVNRPVGLEHGFTLTERPEGDGPLVLALGVAGDLRPVATADGQSLALFAEGKKVADYAGLKAWDADGAPLAARMIVPAEGALRLEVDEARARYPLTIDPTFTQQAYLKASNAGAPDNFGISVAVWGDTVVVGAYAEDGDAASTAAAPNDNSARAGAAYVFVRSGPTWSQQAYLKASNASSNGFFGVSVAVSEDTVVVGAYNEDGDAASTAAAPNNRAPDAGAAYVFVRSGTTWIQQAYLKASNAGTGDLFGLSVAVSDDTLVVGAEQEDGDGASTAAAPNNGASQAGAAYVFVRSGTTWSQQAYLKASNVGQFDHFGWEVAASENTVVVGAYGEDGDAASTAAAPNEGTANAGAAYVFVRFGTTWTQQAYLKASNPGAPDNFGISVAVSGDTAVVGAANENGDAASNAAAPNDNSPRAGAAYVFVRSGTTWSQQAYLKASNAGGDDAFGISVAVSGATAVVGAYFEDGDAASTAAVPNEGTSDAGSAYVFVRSGTTWSQKSYLKASNAGAGDRFGRSVAASEDTAVVGAYTEDGDAASNATSPNNLAPNAGAAYIFAAPALPADDVPPDLTAKDIVLNVPVGGGVAADFSGVVALDAVDGPLPVTCSPGDSAPFPVGVHVIQCQATDLSGNTGTASFRIFVLGIAEAGGPRALPAPFALSGVAAPGAGGPSGLPAGARYGAPTRLYLNDAGDAAFEASLLGAPAANNTAVFSVLGGATAPLAVKGIGGVASFDHLSLAPDGDASFRSDTGADFLVRSFDPDSGDSPAFFPRATTRGLYQHAKAGAADDPAIPGAFRSGAAGVTALTDTFVSTPALLVREGDPAATVPGATYGQIKPRAVAGDSGVIAFSCSLRGVPPGAAEAVLAGPVAGPFAVVAREGDPVPDTGGAVLSGFASESLNAAGQVALRAGLRTGAGVTKANNDVLLTNRSGALELLAREGSPAPCVDDPGVVFGSFREVFVGDDGSVVFFAFLAGSASSSNDGSLWRSDPSGAIHLLAREGEAANNTDGIYRQLLGGTSSSAGRAAFRARLVPGLGDATSTTSLGLWAENPSVAVPQLVIRQGDTFDLAPGDTRTITGITLDATASAQGGSGGYGRVLGDGGHVAARLSLSGNASGAFLLDILP